ncbi:MAG: PD40 domain-containing protein [Armatimonadetes bacterium]|nr:PD40 domain-containing protein [Armatimonadota bacterium]
MRSLLWKEWREVRVLVPVGAGLTLLFLLLGQSGIVGDRDWLVAASITTLFFWPLMAVIVSGGLVATETSSDTLRFLIALPAKRTHLWWAKTLVGLVAVATTLLCSLLFLLLSALFYSEQRDPLALLTRDANVPAGASLALLAFLSGLCCSVLARNPINAVGGGILLAAFMSGAACGVALLTSQAMNPELTGTLVGVWILWVAVSLPVASGIGFARCGLMEGNRHRKVVGAVLVGSFLPTALISGVLGAVRTVGEPSPPLVRVYISGVLPSPNNPSQVLVSTSGHGFGQENLWLLSIDGPAVRWVDLGARPSWSPDGKQIAYACDRGLLGLRRVDRAWEVWIYDVATGKRRAVPLPRGRGTFFVTRAPTWSPDSNRLLVVRSVVRLGTALKQILSMSYGARLWEELIFSDCRDEAWIVSTHGETPRRVRTLPDESIIPLKWSKDGRTVYLASQQQLYRADLDSLVARPVAPRMRTRTDMVMASHGDRALLRYFGKSGPIFQVMDIDGRRLTRLSVPKARMSRPTLSPDGKCVSYEALDASRRHEQVVVIDVDTMEHRTLCSLARSAPGWSLRDRLTSGLAWSPDSRRIAFADRDRGGRVLLVNVATGILRNVVPENSGAVSNIDWLDDHHVLYSEGTIVLWLANIDGTERHQVFPPVWGNHARGNPELLKSTGPRADSKEGER